MNTGGRGRGTPVKEKNSQRRNSIGDYLYLENEKTGKSGINKKPKTEPREETA